MKKLFTRENAWILITSALFLLVVYLSEAVARLNDQVRIFVHPAQIQVTETAKAQKMQKPLPAIRGIECKILPCGAYTGKYRECVVGCILDRGL